MQAATSLIPVLQTEDMARAHPHLSPVYKSALYFFGGVIAWYDILSCATTVMKPSYSCNCLRLGQGYINLDKLMGCENWTMCIISDIAMLNQSKETSHKETTQNDNKLSMHQLAVQGAEIEQRLEEGLEKSATEGLKSKDVHNITRIFACAALVYLHVVVSGPDPHLPKIQSAVSRTIKAFQSLPDPAVMRNLVWPFCIAGCMAVEEQKLFFRRMEPTTSSPLPRFGISCKALAIVEECWRLRKFTILGANYVDWNTAMESLRLSVLLV